MPSPRSYHYPKVVAVKETSPHRKTKVHTVVPRAESPKAPRERARPQG